MLSIKSTISQKLKIAQENTHELKTLFQNNGHLLVPHFFLAKWLKKIQQQFFKSGHIYMIYEECAETNKKSIFRCF